MIRAGRGGDEAFEVLVRRWENGVLAFLTKSCGDWSAAQELRQEVFLRVYRHGGTYNPDYAFTTWLFRIVSNVLATWRRKQSKAPIAQPGEALRDAAADASPGPRDAVCASELKEELARAVEGLTPPDRELILLRFDVELTFREIGEALGKPETTVRSRFYAALTKLRRTLARTSPLEGSATRWT